MKLKTLILNIRKSDATSADLRSAHAEIDIEATEATVAELENNRARLLIDGTDSQIANIEKRIETANLECERAHAMAKEIERRIELADIYEEQARRQKIYEVALAKKRKASDALRDYVSAAEKIRKSLLTLSEAELAISETNEALPDNCEPIISSEREAELSTPGNQRLPLVKTVNLPGVKPNARPFWMAISETWASPIDAARLALKRLERERSAAATAE